MARGKRATDDWMIEPAQSASLAAVDGWHRLAAAMLLVACREAEGGDLGACEFLSSPVALAAADLAQIDVGIYERKRAEWAAAPAGRITIRAVDARRMTIV